MAQVVQLVSTEADRVDQTETVITSREALFYGLTVTASSGMSGNPHGLVFNATDSNSLGNVREDLRANASAARSTNYANPIHMPNGITVVASACTAIIRWADVRDV